MLDDIGYILSDLAHRLWDLFVSIYPHPAYVAIPIFMLLGIFIFGFVRHPLHNVFGLLIVAAAFVLVMPAGVSSMQMVWDQEGLESKYTCLVSLDDKEYWTGEANSATKCQAALSSSSS